MIEAGAHLGNVRISGREGRLESPPIAGRAIPFGTFRLHDEIVLYNGGVVAKRRCVPGRMPPGGGRGKIYGFSLASRRRLRQRVMRIAWDTVESYWVTLTYHNRWGKDWRDWKADLQAFFKRLKRAYPSHVGIIWRLEFQKRGAPHYHLVVSFPPDCSPDRSVFRSWVRDAWLDVVGGLEDRAFSRYGVRVVRADRNLSGRSMSKLLNYIVKDMGKVDQGVAIDKETGEVMPTGRTWGVRGKMPEYLGEKVVFHSEEDFDKYVERVKESEGSTGWFIDSLSPKWEGWTMVGDGFGQFADLLEGLDVSRHLICDE